MSACSCPVFWVSPPCRSASWLSQISQRSSSHSNGSFGGCQHGVQRQKELIFAPMLLPRSGQAIRLSSTWRPIVRLWTSSPGCGIVPCRRICCRTIRSVNTRRGSLQLLLRRFSEVEETDGFGMVVGLLRGRGGLGFFMIVSDTGDEDSD